LKIVAAGILLVIASIVPPAAGGGSAAPPEDRPRMEKLADGVWAWVRRDPPGLMVDGNSLVIVNDRDVVVVDAPEATTGVVAELRRITSKPVSYVVHTHWHDDHITGDHVYREHWPAVEFVGHASLREYLPTTGAANRKGMIEGAPKFVESLKKLVAEGKSPAGGEITDEERRGYESDFALVDRYMQEVPGAPLILPTLTVEDGLTLHRSDRTIEILHLGRGHTSGDLVVWLPKERILAAGDLVGSPIPLVGSNQSHVGDWGATLAKLRALHPAMIVPGHGPVMRDDAQAALMQTLFDSIRAQVGAAVAKGSDLEGVRKAVDISEFRRKFAGDSKHLGFLFDRYVTGPAVESAYRDATGAK
jgi:cyclase